MNEIEELSIGSKHKEEIKSCFYRQGNLLENIKRLEAAFYKFNNNDVIEGVDKAYVQKVLFDTKNSLLDMRSIIENNDSWK